MQRSGGSIAIKEQSLFIKHDFSVSPHTPEKKEMGLGVEKKGQWWGREGWEWAWVERENEKTK